MAIYRLPPSPFVGGRQPLAPKDFNPAVGEIPPVIDDPIPNSRIPTAVLIAWQIETPYIQKQVFTPQIEEAHIPNPREYVSTFISWAWYWPFQQFLGDLRTWGRSYYPPRPRLIQPDEPEVEDFVPRTSALPIILANWNETIWLIQTPNHLPTESFTEEFVPQGRPLLQIFLEELPLPRLQNKIASLIPFVAPPVNDPPFGQRTWLNTVLTTWIIEAPRVIPSPKIAIEFIPAPVDDPPFGRRVLWLNTVLDAWIPPPPEPWNPILHFTPPPSGDIIIWMWKRVL